MTRIPRRPQRHRRTRSLASPPIVVAVFAVLAFVFVVLPFAGLVVRAPWGRSIELVTNRDVRRALALSAVTSAVATVAAMVLGVPLAWWIVERPGVTSRWVRALVSLTLVTPPVVAGVALFAAYGRRGLIGRWVYDWFGVQLSFTTAAVVTAQAFVSLPFVVLTVEAALAQRDRAVDDAARTLGATSWYTFRRVTMPSVRSALGAAAVLAWARSLGEFGATITFAGNLPGTTQTMPLLVYLRMESEPAAAIMLSLLLAAISLTILVLLRGRWWTGLGGRGIGGSR